MSLDRRRFGLALASLATLPAGCASKRRRLNIWAMGVEGETLGEYGEAFSRDNGDYPVRVQALPWSAAHEKLLTAFAADDLPDIVALGNTWVAEFHALGAVEPLNARLVASPMHHDQFFDAALKSVTLDGQVLGIPWYVDTRLLFYRADLLRDAGFDKPAETWSDWDRQLAALSGGAKASVRQGKYGLLMPFNEYEPLVALCLQADQPILLDNGTRGGFSQPGIRDAFAYAVSMYTRGYAAVLTHSEVNDLYSAFARGDYAFLITGPWNLGEFARRLPAAVKADWATAPLPGPRGAGASSAGGVSMCLARASTNKDIAFRFIEYMAEPKRQAEFYGLTGDLPSDRRAWPAVGLMQDARARAFFDQLNRAKPAPQVPEWERIANEMVAALERVVRGQATLDAALKGLDEFTWTTLARRRAMLGRSAAA